MSLFVISDLHLDVLTNEKSMEVFGDKWKDYTKKIQKNWSAIVDENDTVVIPGDISWALNLEESLENRFKGKDENRYRLIARAEELGAGVENIMSVSATAQKKSSKQEAHWQAVIPLPMMV